VPVVITTVEPTSACSFAPGACEITSPSRVGSLTGTFEPLVLKPSLCSVATADVRSRPVTSGIVIVCGGSGPLETVSLTVEPRDKSAFDRGSVLLTVPSAYVSE
jgi:hypothetical protein